MQAPTIGNSQGYSTYQYSGGAASCTAGTASKLFSGATYSTGCLVATGTASMYMTNSGCASTNTGATLSVTQIMTGVTVAQAQGASFQAKFISAIANYIGVASSSIAITGVTSSRRRLGETTSTSTSRELLQTGVKVAYTVTAASINPTTTSTLLANAGPVVATALASSIPTIAAATGSGVATVTGVNTPTPVGSPTLEPFAAAAASTAATSAASCFAASEMVMLSSGQSLPIDQVSTEHNYLIDPAQETASIYEHKFEHTLIS